MLQRFHRLALIAAACGGLSGSLFAAGPAARAAAQPTSESSSPTRISDHLRKEVQTRLGYATSLAERGATLSAREETVNALKLIARALDSGDAAGTRTRALEDALKRLFDNSTVTVHAADESRLRQESYQTAATQLGQAFAGDALASNALYTLGRLQLISLSAGSDDSQFARPRAVALFLAAVGSDRGNTAAAHELGTMFATLGQLEQAAHWLELSTRSATHPESWENLAAVYHRMGLTEKEAEARLQAQTLASHRDSTASSSGVTWVDHETFTRTASSDPSVPRSIELTSGESRAVQPGRVPQDGAAATKASTGRRWPFFSGRNKR
jgi:tetratricopeptide (TPR) repeat protein